METVQLEIPIIIVSSNPIETKDYESSPTKIISTGVQINQSNNRELQMEAIWWQECRNYVRPSLVTCTRFIHPIVPTKTSGHYDSDLEERLPIPSAAYPKDYTLKG